jgi:hypothetical protein
MEWEGQRRRKGERGKLLIEFPFKFNRRKFSELSNVIQVT